jgi:hypothetical protein
MTSNKQHASVARIFRELRIELRSQSLDVRRVLRCEGPGVSPAGFGNVRRRSSKRSGTAVVIFRSARALRVGL